MDGARHPLVVSLLEEMRLQGASISYEPVPERAAVAAAEARLGFALPAEYREFLAQFGGIRIELERTWLFYGLASALDMTAGYAEEFESFRTAAADGGQAEASDGPYYPRRFLVLMDEGDFSNAASGTVYDADLDAMLETDGGRWVSREDAVAMGYWALLLDALEAVRDRIADQDDILVSGGERDRARKQAARAAYLASHPLPPDDLDAARERLYVAFAHHPRLPIQRRCFLGPDCADCQATDRVLESTALRDLTSRQLEHYAYYVLARRENALYASQAEVRRDFLHVVPRILDLAEEVAMMGNPSVVLQQVFGTLTDPLELSGDEWAAVRGYFTALWARLLACPPDLDDMNQDITDYLRNFAIAGLPVNQLLAVWSSLLARETACLHLAKKLRYYQLDYTAEQVGWYGQDQALAALHAWLRRPEVAVALSGARDAAAPTQRRLYDQALETLAAADDVTAA